VFSWHSIQSIDSVIDLYTT